MTQTSIPLPLATVEALAPHRRPQRSLLLLTGTHGPLAAVANSAFSDDVAGLAYLLHLAWRAGRRVDLLGKLVAWEARDRFGARVRSEATRAGDPMEFAVNLFRKLGTSTDQLEPESSLWLREFAGSVRSRWWTLMDRVSLEESLTACHLVGDWLYQIHAALGTEDPADAEPETAGDPT
jgi:hypothetical protein